MANRNNPALPDGQYAITEADKVEIRELGKKLLSFFETELADRESVHMKILVGACEYVMQLQEQKRNLIGHDFIFAKKAVEQFKLEDQLEEPFAPAPVEEKPVPAAVCLVSKKNEDGTPGDELGRFDIFGTPNDPIVQKDNQEKIDAIVTGAGLTKDDVVVAFGSVETVAAMDAKKHADPDVEDASVSPTETATPSPIQREDLEEGNNGAAA